VPELVLVVEDDKSICDLVRYNLERAGYRVATAGDGQEALRRVFASVPDAVVLDLMLPSRNGLEILRELRSQPVTQGTAVIVLTARVTEMDRLLAFEYGADDYLAKPFSVSELIARVRALLRRTRPARTGTVIEVGELCISVTARLARLSGEPLLLTPLEFDLMLFLASHPNVPHSREELLRKVWGYDHVLGTRTVDVHVRRLRAKLGASAWMIETRFRTGYCFLTTHTNGRARARARARARRPVPRPHSS